MKKIEFLSFWHWTALSHQPLLLLITCRAARLGFNRVNGLAKRYGAARGPLLARCDNAVPGIVTPRLACGLARGRMTKRMRRARGVRLQLTKEDIMKVGVIGSGVVGQTLAAGFLKHGHEIEIGTREPAKLKE
jgi:hypothetical protein